MDRQTDERVDWSVPEIGVGDVITIKIIETDQITPASSRVRRVAQNKSVDPPEPE